MVQAWYMDDVEGDQREKHMKDKNSFLDLAEVERLTGVEYFKIDLGDSVKLEKIKSERNYSYEDELVCSKECLPNYEEKLKIFFAEHLHTDEEIRLVLDGSGYFDVRDNKDQWIRIKVEAGDLIILPSGIYHRFTLDTNNFIKAKRFFKGEPVWTPHNRPAEDMECRKEFDCVLSMDEELLVIKAENTEDFDYEEERIYIKQETTEMKKEFIEEDHDDEIWMESEDGMFGIKREKCDQGNAASKSKLFKCTPCWTKLNSSGDLRKHLQLHFETKPLKCEVCHKKFLRYYNLKAHMRIHTGERPYSCEYCEKAFSDPNNLKKHIRTHTGEKPFSCEFCEKKFTRTDHLKTHMRFHTGKKPFSCLLCDKKFIQSIDLKKHLRIHTGERPFACDLCEKKFNRADHLRSHIKTHSR